MFGFQSTLPVRGATVCRKSPAHKEQFQSTLPVRGATPMRKAMYMTRTFQSTLPVRGATIKGVKEPAMQKNFNPRSPCGERRQWTERYGMH